MKKEYGVLTEVTEEDIKLLINNPREFWNNVTEIGDEAFKDLSGLFNIKIPETVKKIGEFAFMGCVNLRSVTLNNNITRLEKFTFAHCTNLEYINLSDNIEDIANNVFLGCKNLKNVLMSSKLKNITGFSSSGITEVDIPEGVISIENSAFAGCSQLVSVNLPKSVKYIKEGAFSKCTSLEEIDLNEGLTEIDIGAFNGCTKFKHIKFPKSLEKIGDSALRDCTGLKEIILTENIKEIGNEAFFGCNGLESVTISENPIIITSRGKELKNDLDVKLFSYNQKFDIYFKNYKIPKNRLGGDEVAEMLIYANAPYKEAIAKLYSHNIDVLSLDTEIDLLNVDTTYWDEFMKDIEPLLSEEMARIHLRVLTTVATYLNLFNDESSLGEKNDNKNAISKRKNACEFLKSLIKNQPIEVICETLKNMSKEEINNQLSNFEKSLEEEKQ